MGTNTYFVHPANSGRGTTMLSHKYVPKQGQDFSIDNGVRLSSISVVVGFFQSLSWSEKNPNDICIYILQCFNAL